MKPQNAMMAPLTGDGLSGSAGHRLLEEFDRIVIPFAQAANLALAYIRDPSTQWLTTSTGCLCSRNGDFTPACVDRPRGQERICHQIDLGQRDTPMGRLVVCCNRNDRGLPAAIEHLARSINRQIELEREEELLLDELSASWESLEAVYEISSKLGPAMNPQELLEQIINRAAAFRGGLKAVLWLEREGMLYPVSKGLGDVADPMPRPREGGIIGRVMSGRNGIILNGRDRIESQDSLETEFRNASNLALVPLIFRDSCLGALVVWQEEENGEFDSHNMRFLATLALQAAMMLENERLHRASLESERLRQQVEIGSKIQQTLLLGQVPVDFYGIQVAALTIPSQMIDGDFYDFIKPHDRCLDVISGDVMGKGIPAALVGAATKSHFLRAMSQLLSTSARRRLPEPHEIVAFVHDELVKQLITLESFVTLCYARFDLEQKQVYIVDCGHTRTVRYRRSSARCDLLKGVNLPIGFVERETYEQFSLELEAGDLFFFYSDGLTEAMNEAGEAFGEDRLVELITRNSRLNPEALLAKIHRSLIDFAGRETLNDDLTCVAVRIADPVYPSLPKQSELTLLSDPKNLEQCRAFVRRVCADASHPAINAEYISQLELAVNEAVANVIEHAYHERPDQSIQLTADVHDDRVAIQIRHEGAPFDPDTAPEPLFDGSKDGGFGVYIITQVVDEITYASGERGEKVIYLVKKSVEET